MGTVRFDQVNVVVPDVAAAAGFLRGLGVDVEEPTGEWAEWGRHHVRIPTASDGFDADLDSGAFASHWGGLPRDFSGVVVNLRTEDRAGVDEAYDQAVSQGAEGLQPPYDAFWGARFAVVRAPGPVAVGIMSPVDPDRRSGPPALSDFT